MLDFRYTNFAKFRKLRLELFCTSEADPGQLIYTRSSVLHLVHTLMSSRGKHIFGKHARGKRAREKLEDCKPYSMSDVLKELPRLLFGNDADHRASNKLPVVEIAFLDYGAYSWQKDSGARQTFSGVEYPENDLELLVSSFSYLHNAHSIKFSFPEDVKPGAQLLSIIQSVQKESCSSYSPSSSSNGLLVSQVSHANTPNYYQDLMRKEVNRYLNLEEALDTLDGHAADILRRERLIHWRWYRSTIDHMLGKSLEMYQRGFKYRDKFFRDYGWKLYEDRNPRWLDMWRSMWPEGITVAHRSLWT